MIIEVPQDSVGLGRKEWLEKKSYFAMSNEHLGVMAVPEIFMPWTHSVHIYWIIFYVFSDEKLATNKTEHKWTRCLPL